MTSLVEERPHLSAARRVLQLAQGFGFNLPDPLAGDAELLPDLLERVTGVHADAEAHAQTRLGTRRPLLDTSGLMKHHPRLTTLGNAGWMEHVADIVRAAGAGPLAFFALGIIILAYLSLKWFGTDHISVRLTVFLVLLGMIFLAPFLIKLLDSELSEESGAVNVSASAQDSQANATSPAPADSTEAGQVGGRQPGAPTGSSGSISQPQAPAIVPAASRMEQSIRSGRFTVYFAHDSVNLAPDEAAYLDDVADEFIRSGARSVIIEGHTDRWGSADHNADKSSRMAQDVGNYLSARGVPPGIITTEAFGESRPAVPTDDGVPEAANRRVEIRFVR